MANRSQWAIDKATCKIAEKYGAQILWANDPKEFEHIIQITPRDLRRLVIREAALSSRRAKRKTEGNT